MNSKLKKVLVLSPLIIFIFLLFASSCMTFRQTDSQTLADFEKRNTKGLIKRVDFENKEVRFIESGMDDGYNNLIVFVHGAPGSSRDMLPFLYDSLLLKQSRMISIDRLGYGYSDYGNAEVSISKQADLVKAIIQNAQESNIILVGHSFGGPIVAKAALLSTNISSVLMLAPVNDPYNEKMFWISNFGKWKITRWMLSKAFKVAADEKFAHEDELLKMKDDWKSLQIPIVHIHGQKDWIAPISNANWSEKNISTKYLKLINDPELDHFIPFTNHDLVVNELLLLLK